MTRSATRNDWNTEDLPKEHTTLRVERHFSKEELDRIRQGLVPEEMEEKWFIFFEDDTIHFHRSWTGYCTYRVHLAPGDDGGASISSIEANRDPEQYKENDDAYDAKLVPYLIDVLLLNRDAEYPCQNSSAYDLLHEWSNVGKAMLSKGQDEPPDSPL